MTIYRTSLSAPVFGLRREIDRLFEDTFGSGNGAASGWTPVVDVKETEKELTLAVELPGVKPNDVDITHENGVLTIHGQRQESRKEGDDNARYHVVERSYGEFSRSFQLPKGLDDSKIEAGFDNGLLTIHVPKTALPQPKKIAIKATSESSAK